MRVLLIALVVLGGCASRPKLVMVNPRSGALVDCEVPDVSATSADYLVSRACLSACQAHGFRPVPGTQATGPGGTIPTACTN